MPPMERAFRRQKALLWVKTGSDAYGQPAVDSANPVELKVRWDDVRKEVIGAQGNTVRVDAEVVVDRAIPVGSKMWLGGFLDLPGTADLPEEDLMEVVTYDETPDLKNRVARRTVTLMRSKDSL